MTRPWFPRSTASQSGAATKTGAPDSPRVGGACVEFWAHSHGGAEELSLGGLPRHKELPADALRSSASGGWWVGGQK